MISDKPKKTKDSPLDQGTKENHRTEGGGFPDKVFPEHTCDDKSLQFAPNLANSLCSKETFIIKTKKGIGKLCPKKCGIMFCNLKLNLFKGEGCR